jgi:hypothetical protein
LDKKVREWVFPEHLQLPGPPENDYTSISRILQRTIMFSTREITLMYLHRSYFAHAVMEPPYDPLRSKYARSVLAAYGSACAIIGRLRTLQAHEPRLMERFSIFWSHAFSALVIVASIVSRAPACPLSSTAIVEVGERGTISQTTVHCNLTLLGKIIALKCSRRQTMHTDLGVSWSVSCDRSGVLSVYLTDFTAHSAET